MVKYLVELRIIAAFHFVCDITQNRITSLKPESRVVTSFVIVIAKLEVVVLSRGVAPPNLVLSEQEWRRRIEITIERNQISHGGHGVIQDHIHPSVVDCLGGLPPHIDVSQVLIEYRKVKWGILIGSPWGVYHRATSDVDSLDSHSLNIVQTVDESLKVTTMSQLRLHNIVFEECAINIVVTWVAVDEFIEEKSVKRKAPVVRRLIIIMLQDISQSNPS